MTMCKGFLKIVLCCLTVIALNCGCTANKISQGGSPNVVIILMDDMGYDDISEMENRSEQNPAKVRALTKSYEEFIQSIHP